MPERPQQSKQQGSGHGPSRQPAAGPLHGPIEQVFAAASLRAQMLSASDHALALLDPEAESGLDRRDRLALEHLIRGAHLQRRASRWIESAELLRGGPVGVLALARFELWLSKAGLPAEVGFMRD